MRPPQRTTTSGPTPVSWATAPDLTRAATNQLAHGFFQWCIVTPDLDAACERLEQLYGVPVWFRVDNAPLLNATYRGTPTELSTDVAFGYLGETNVEVISPRPNGADDLYRAFLRDHPAGGMHHLGFRVYDVDSAVATLESQHGAPVQTGEFGTGGTRFAYFDTREVTGLYTEVISFDQSSEALMAALRDGSPPAHL